MLMLMQVRARWRLAARGGGALSATVDVERGLFLTPPTTKVHRWTPAVEAVGGVVGSAS